MKGFLSGVKRLLKSEDGAVATEYAVMLALIIIVAIAAIGPLGIKVTQMFTDANTGLGGP
jgi:pilus assembly protein Flp/PilA